MTMPTFGQICINLWYNLSNYILLISAIYFLYFIFDVIQSTKITNTILIKKSIKLIMNFKYYNLPPLMIELT